MQLKLRSIGHMMELKELGLDCGLIASERGLLKFWEQLGDPLVLGRVIYSLAGEPGDPDEFFESLKEDDIATAPESIVNAILPFCTASQKERIKLVLEARERISRATISGMRSSLLEELLEQGSNDTPSGN